MKRCGLKRSLGMHARCDSGRCVFWRHPDSEHGQERPMCVLERYDLANGKANQVTRWLFEYKVSRDRARIRKINNGPGVPPKTAATDGVSRRLSSG